MVIVMFLSLSNFASMMSASIQNRSREFAILESIGMTGRQIRKMVMLESLCYAGAAILLSLLAGLPAGYFVAESFNIYGIPVSFPVAGDLMLFVCMTGICLLTGLSVTGRRKKETVIELLRKGED